MARSSTRKRQGRLAFTPLPSSSPASKGYNQQIRDRAAAVIVEDSSSPTGKLRKLRHSGRGGDVVPSYSNEQGSALLTPNPSSSRKIEFVSDSDSDSGPVHSVQRRSHPGVSHGPKSGARQQSIDFSKIRDPSTFDSPVKLPSSSHNIPTSSRSGMFRTSGQPRLIDDSSDDSDDDNKLPSPSGFLNGSTEDEAQHGEDEIVVNRPSASEREAESDEDEDMPTILGKRKRSRRNTSPQSFKSSPPPQIVESDDDDVVIIDRSMRLRTRNRQNSELDEEADEGSDALPITPRRKLKRRRQMTQQEKDDLDEDLDFLGTSDLESTARTPRDTQSVKKNARQKALEALRRRRNGNLQDVEEEPEEEELESFGGDEGIADQDTDDDVQIISSRQMFQADDEDAGFLTDEGDDAPLGVPDGMPIEFTQYASKKPKELFKYAVEWMVQKKINPAYEGNDELYQLAFMKLDDEVRALAGSKFTSSAWTPKFTIALQARPELAYELLDRTSAEHFFRDKCDACNRGSHPATFEIRFQGNPYFHGSLEDVVNEDEEENDSDSGTSTSSQKAENESRPAYDEQGREVVPANTKFFVGKFCMANAQTAHSLRHWRYHLNEWVITWLIRSGYCSPEKVVERDGWKTSKRRKHANKIVDRMEREGTVKELWRSFRDSTDAARNSKQGRFGGDSLD